MPHNLKDTFGNIDIYLFDQLLKGRYDGLRSVIDLGCGGGRNIVWFLQNGYQVSGIDTNPAAIDAVRELSATLALANDSSNFQVAPIEDIPFPDATFDLVICSAVLHFATSPQQFDTMIRSAFRVLKPGGHFFARLASDIGIEPLVLPLGNGCYLLPDGSTRFLVNEAMLLQNTTDLNATLTEPIKTTNVQNLRCMTAWCLQKN